MTNFVFVRLAKSDAFCGKLPAKTGVTEEKFRSQQIEKNKQKSWGSDKNLSIFKYLLCKAAEFE